MREIDFTLNGKFYAVNRVLDVLFGF